MEVELGSIYQIDQSKLTPRTPVPLRSIRLVMVSEKTEANVSVRYPSIESLKRYFNNKFNEIYPEMDQKFVMDRKLAERVLVRRVPSEEFLVKKDMEEFWLVMSSSGNSEKLGDVVSKKAGICLSELKSSGVPGWAVRRQVKFIGRHREVNTSPSSSSVVIGVREAVVGDEEAEVEKKDEDDEEKEEEEEEEEEVEEEKEEVKMEIIDTYQRPKRKCCEVKLKLYQNAKKGKFVKKSMIKKKPENNSKQIVLAKNPMSTRWSEDRYKQAQVFLLEVMKAQGAFYEKPILRPELRAEARKKIGDTGLLDHLLKHMAGMVAPGGTERFQRRHNADGAMEYWLESADLVDIRREAGVKDPYWTPPPGWKVGDCPTQDPICAKELKELKEETSRLKRVMKDMISRKQMEKEMAKVRREMKKLIAKNQKKENQAIVVSNPGQKDLEAIPTPLNSDSSSVSMEKYYKEQLTILSDHFTRIEGEMVKLKSKVVEKASSEQALIAPTGAFTEKDKTKSQASGLPVLVHPQLEKGTVETDMKPVATASGGATAEAKAAKIERLKSGFRICKPQGTFLWPNSNNTSNVVVQVEDMSVVPTPPSVSSSTTFVPPLLPPSPVRPTPERRAITVTVSSVGNSNFSSTTTTTTAGSSNKTTTWINLNDVPRGNGDGGFCGTPSSRQQTVSTATSVVPPVSVKGGPKQSSVGSCSKVGTWLALAAPTDSIEGPTRG